MRIEIEDTYELDDDPARIDRDAAWDFLSTEVYWGTWRSRADLEKQLDGAWRLIGVYDVKNNRMVGFARAISDGVAFAYLADVYVLPEARGHGLGKEIVRFMLAAGPDFRWTLHTADAHGLYKQFGFTEPDGMYLERPGSRAVQAQDLS
jgi:GNAT superfamily N-acetyltransferase